VQRTSDKKPGYELKTVWFMNQPADKNRSNNNKKQIVRSHSVDMVKKREKKQKEIHIRQDAANQKGWDRCLPKDVAGKIGN
jgi:hypothetical protein